MNRIIKIVLVVFCLFISTKTSLGQISPGDDLKVLYEKAQVVVKNFCQAWMNKDFSRMYDLLSKTASHKQNKMDFTRKYSQYTLIFGPLTQHLLSSRSRAEGGRMWISAEVETTEKPSIEEKTVRAVEMHLIMSKEKNWRVEKVHVPMPRSDG